MSRLGLALAFSVAAGVAMAEPAGEVLQPPPDPASGEAVIYIHYLKNQPQFRLLVGTPPHPTFLIDGAKVATLGKSDCTAVRVKAGPHVLSQTWDNAKMDPLQVNGKWVAGRSYYYEFTYKNQVDTLRWYLLPIGEPAGRERLAGCRFVPPATASLP